MSHQPGRVAVIATGGTISSLPGDDGAIATWTGAEVLEAAGVNSTRVGPVVDVARVNGSDMTPELMRRVAAACEQAAAREDVTGVVVTHGTDSLEESAYWCDLTVDTKKPIVMTGAMRPPGTEAADGAENVRRAVDLAAHPEAAGFGCLVCVGEQLHAARWARKVDTTGLDPFESPDAGPLGVIDPDGSLRLHRRVAPRRVMVPESGGLPAVPVVTAYTGMPEELVLTVADTTGAQGLVLEAFGAGNLPSSIAPAVEKLLSGGVQVAIATRVLRGGVRPIYGGPGGHARLVGVGVLSSPWLTAAKTRLLLIACLAARPTDVRTLFDHQVEATSPVFGRTE